MHPLQGASFLSTPLQGGILKPPALRVVVDFVDRFEPFDRVQGDASFELSTITFPLYRHLLSPPPSHIDTAFYLNHLSSFRGTLYSGAESARYTFFF